MNLKKLVIKTTTNLEIIVIIHANKEVPYIVYVI